MITVPAIKFESNASKILERLRQRTRKNPIIESREEWIEENGMQATYDSNYIEWRFAEEEHAVMFKLRFGL